MRDLSQNTLRTCLLSSSVFNGNSSRNTQNKIMERTYIRATMYVQTIRRHNQYFRDFLMLFSLFQSQT